MPIRRGPGRPKKAVEDEPLRKRMRAEERAEEHHMLPLVDAVEPAAPQAAVEEQLVLADEGIDCVEVGRMSGRLGGRPRKCEALVLRESGGGKRDESFGIQAKAAACKDVEKLVSTGLDEKEAIAVVALRLSRPRKQLRAAWDNRNVLRKALVELGMSATGMLRSEAQMPKYLRKNRGKPMRKRAQGAGRKSSLAFMYPAVGLWFNEMRSSGQYVDKKDCGYIMSALRVVSALLHTHLNTLMHSLGMVDHL